MAIIFTFDKSFKRKSILRVMVFKSHKPFDINCKYSLGDCIFSVAWIQTCLHVNISDPLLVLEHNFKQKREKLTAIQQWTAAEQAFIIKLAVFAEASNKKMGADKTNIFLRRNMVQSLFYIIGFYEIQFRNYFSQWNSFIRTKVILTKSFGGLFFLKLNLSFWIGLACGCWTVQNLSSI